MGPEAKTHGVTYDEAMRNGQEVLAMLVDAAQEQGQPLPPPRVFAMSA